jgi:signal transduction histidine kinase
MLHRLRPSLLDTFGLGDSLVELVSQWRERHAHIACDLQASGDFTDVPDALGITIYRLVQEALTNVARHSHAGRVSVRLERCETGAEHEGGLRLTVTDDGTGLGPASATPGLGLLGMRERVIAAGGEFLLQGAPRHGVQIVATLPLAAPAGAGTAR